MTEKNKEKQERKEKRKTWAGLYPRKTKTKREKEVACARNTRGEWTNDRSFLLACGGRRSRVPGPELGRMHNPDTKFSQNFV